MNNTIVIILIAIAVLILALTAFLIIRRQRYVRALRGRGWTFESRPALESVLDHHAPPFGLGFVRKVDEAGLRYYVGRNSVPGIRVREQRGRAAIRRASGEHAAAYATPRSVRLN